MLLDNVVILKNDCDIMRFIFAFDGHKMGKAWVVYGSSLLHVYDLQKSQHKRDEKHLNEKTDKNQDRRR